MMTYRFENKFLKKFCDSDVLYTIYQMIHNCRESTKPTLGLVGEIEIK